jgi:hypothetical protein
MPLKKRDGELILDWMEDIGMTWIGDGHQTCEESPSETLKRFKLYQQSMMALGLSLWDGTALLIPCNDMAFPEDDEFGWYKKDSNGKELLITVSVYVGKNRGSSNIIKEFHTYIVDTMQILPSEYWNYKQSFVNLEDLHGLLEKIEGFIS